MESANIPMTSLGNLKVVFVGKVLSIGIQGFLVFLIPHIANSLEKQ